MTEQQTPTIPADPFTRWAAEANGLLDFIESAGGRVRTLGAPPPSDDPAARADALAALWQRCGFTPLMDGPLPWEGRASLLGGQLARLPEDFLRAVYDAAGNALDQTLRAGAADPKERFVTTHDLPLFTVEFPRPGQPAPAIWLAVELVQLPVEHVLRRRIADGWRAGLALQPCAVVSPTYGGKPMPFVAVADVVRWTAELRREQWAKESAKEQRRAADEELRLRNEEASERGRLAKLEKQVAELSAK